MLLIIDWIYNLHQCLLFTALMQIKILKIDRQIFDMFDVGYHWQKKGKSSRQILYAWKMLLCYKYTQVTEMDSF